MVLRMFVLQLYTIFTKIIFFSISQFTYTISQTQPAKKISIEYQPADSFKIVISPELFKNSMIITLITLFIVISLIAFIIVRRFSKKYRNKKIQQIIDDRTQIISQEIDKLQQQTDSLKSKNNEVKSKNKELLHESQQLKEINETILEKNRKIEEQARKIFEKNELLTQSLNYARRIQHSLLPDFNEIKKILPKTAMFFQPKEIVSGDFYWMRSIDQKIIIAEVDCTGHGVPGAFMSMIGNTLLNEIVVNKKISAPQEIFKKLNEDLLFIFSHDDFDDEAQDEGMDLTLAVIDKATNKIQIASAMQNYFVIKNDEVHVFRGDIFSIGGLISRLKSPIYTVQEFEIEENIRIIMSSDGFIDQFGGAEKDKYGVDRFFKLINETKNHKIEDQISTINIAFNKWKGDQDQMDDVLIVGFEF